MSRQRGYTLVELMIALVLGLLVTQAVISIFLSSTRSFRTSAGVSEMQEQGRFATLLTSPVIRQAGYLPDPVRTQTVPTDVFQTALDKQAIRGFNNSAPTIYTGFDSTTVKTATDVLAIAYLGHDAASDTTLKTCLGDAVTSGQMAVNVFYITVANSAGLSSLGCYTNISLPGSALSTGATRNEVLIDGITDLQAVYGVDSDGDRTPNQYFTANLVTDWTQVVSVKLSFTADSASKAVAGTPDSSGDDGVKGGRIRRSFSTTLQIRNRLS